MTEPLASAPTDELVARFAEAARKSIEAKNAGDVAEGNDQAAEVWEVAVELHRRESQSALLKLLEDADASVRLSAATDALSYAPQRAEPMLVELTSFPGKTGEIAAMILDLWREGRLPSP